jgi:hypothetical protein
VTRTWNPFFGAVSIVILTTMALPEIAGMQRFTQWGGMYVDGWCNVVVAPVSLLDDPDTETYEIREDQHNVWFTPMHNEESCIAWARSYCNTPSPSGWTVLSAYAYFRSAYLADDADICALPPRPSFQWYSR